MPAKNKKIIIIAATSVVLFAIICAIIIAVVKNKNKVEYFAVHFTQENTIKSDKVTVKGTAQTQDATLEIDGMINAGDTEYAVLEIKNANTEEGKFEKISVEVLPEGYNQDYFNITTVMCDKTGTIEYTEDQTVSPEEITYAKVTVELTTTTESPQKATLKVKLIDTPIE